MKKVGLVIILILGLISGITAQDKTDKSDKELKKEQKEANKKARKEAQTEAIKKANLLITSRYWVVEATTLQGKQGSVATNLDPNLNFVVVENDKGIIQLGLNGPAGLNGVGGITLEGDITSYEVKEGKTENHPVRLSARFSGPAVIAMLRMTISGEFADVIVTGAFSNDRINFRGRLVHPSESEVFVGRKSN